MLSRIDSGTSYTGGMPAIKKLFPVRRALNMLNIFKLGSDLSVPFRTYSKRMELAPCPLFGGTGCQGFCGPFPSAFLDKQIKN